MKAKPRILFLCHSASRSGAPILLLSFLRWLHGHFDADLEVLLGGSGPMLGDFQSAARTTVRRNLGALTKGLPHALRSRIEAVLQKGYLRALTAGRRYDLIYANSTATWPCVEALATQAPRLLWHIHELGYGLRLTMGEVRGRHMFAAASRFIAVSGAVRNMLERDVGVPADRIDLVHECVPVAPLSNHEHLARRQRIRFQLQWPTDAFVVGGCGSLGWRKGTDIFLQIAGIVGRDRRREDIRFLWVGGSDADTSALEFRYDAETLGLGERCRIVPATEKVSDYYCAMDAFALTSREDPFPLVMLEAGAHGVPTVCFADSGGATEYVGEDSGMIAPYLDTARFAAHLERLHDEPSLRARLGGTASEKVRTCYSVETQAPKLLQSIERCLA